MPTLIYGKFKILNAPATIKDGKATFTKGEGTVYLDFGNGGNDLPVKTFYEGESVSVERVGGDYKVIDDQNPDARSLFYFAETVEPITLKGPNSWSSFRLDLLDSYLVTVAVSRAE